MILELQRGSGVTQTPEDRISADELAAFIDGRLTEDERGRLEATLAADPEARAEMIAASRLVEQVEDQPVRRQRQWKWTGIAVAATAAAAAIAVFYLPSERQSGLTADVVTERQTAAEDGGRIELVSPRDNQPVTGRALQFVWRAEGNASYRLTLADSAGATVWSTATYAAQAMIPDTVRLGAGKYYWYVDAMLLDGSSITSGPRAFTIKPP